MTSKSIVIAITAIFLITERANAFVFTDLVAKVQRVQMMRQTSQYIGQIENYRQEFLKYQQQFDRYFASFSRVYRHLAPSDWINFSSVSWPKLKDHFITLWKTFDEEAWQTQVLALRTSPQYSSNPDYRTYADNLIALSEDQISHLKMEEAHLIELQNRDAEHFKALERFKATNAALVVGTDQAGSEIALSQQLALTNAILIEMASIQAETKVVEQRLLTDQKEQRNLIMKMKQLEIEAQKNDLRNFDQLLTITGSN